MEPWQLRHQEGSEGEGQDKVMVFNTVVKGCSLDYEIGKHPELEDLYSAYKKVFDITPLKDRTKDLLQVLLAAQEPLSMLMIHQMSFDEVLYTLPGWGTLFYVSDHHVYLLHKVDVNHLFCILMLGISE